MSLIPTITTVFWAVTSDNTTNGTNFDPVLVTSIQGPGATLTSTSVSLDTAFYSNDYALDIAAGETRSLLVYHEMYVDISASAARSGDCNSSATPDSSGLLSGLSNVQRSQVANYGLPVRCTACCSCCDSRHAGLAAGYYGWFAVATGHQETA